ncbi:MAG TPA: DNA repair protein RecO [Clostridia bacterium]|nr:DNA repair protein RecO [Clostridia bacterium]
MGLYKAEGIILKSFNLGEADRVLTIYTRQYGKISAVAKGVRKSRSKLRGATQTLTHAALVLYRGRSMDTITQCEAKEMFPGIRADLYRWAYATFMLELVDAFAPEGQPQTGVFVRLLLSLHLVETLEEPELGALFFAVHLLQLLGYQPQLQNCAACGSSLPEPDLAALSGSFGGLLCRACESLDPYCFNVQGGEIAVWRRLLTSDARLLGRLKLSAKLKQDLLQALKYYVQYHLERQLKSVSFLRHLNLLDQDKIKSSKEDYRQ